MNGILFRRKSIDEVILDSRNTEGKERSLKRDLTVKDLTAFGIAAIVGAGIFGSFGKAAAEGGPAISLLFIFTALACGFSAICYAEFASRVPISGSAYTYAYCTFGEFVAWIIGWDLLLEYAVGNIAVAISWSDYFTQFMKGFNLHFPEYLSIDYLSAMKANSEVISQLAGGLAIDAIPSYLREGYLAWQTAPHIGNIRLIADIPAVVIVIIITMIVFIGIKESKLVNNILVAIKLLVIFAVIVIGSFYVNPENWNPFAPEGISGILRGVSAVFFAYIGFDAISTTAEECRNPSKDMPRAIIYSLIICTVIYVLVSLILTGMVNYKELNVGDPLAFIFEKVGLNMVAGIVAFTALVAMSGVLLIFQLGQPRILMSMSRDGLLPKVFSRIHPIFKTPSFATIITGILVAIPSMTLNLTVVLDLTSIGTLFAFVVVCGGILLLKDHNYAESNGFKVPYINSRFIVPFLIVLTVALNYMFNRDNLLEFLGLGDNTGAFLTWEKIPMWIFILITLVTGIFCYLKKLSLIPVLGLLSCLFLMTELGHTNWLRFLLWLLTGLIIYFSFSIKNSRLNHPDKHGKN